RALPFGVSNLTRSFSLPFPVGISFPVAVGRPFVFRLFEFIRFALADRIGAFASLQNPKMLLREFNSR
ncbi:hypothetical protein AAHZ94_27495, partial [Streptomyces sp. HSW2009]|uniref:hypothetical protein n=1 Tax=Streptomyces sp. HSW2009 TaxID=3142890 RepID=UPI0032ED68F6